MMHTYVCSNNPPCDTVVQTIVDSRKHGAVTHLCKKKRRNGQPVLVPMVRAGEAERKAS